MKVYELTVDNKVEVWRRDKVQIKAKSLEEAISIAESGEYDYVYDTEYLSDTEVYLTPDKNGDMTCEIMDDSGNSLWDNKNKSYPIVL